MPVRDLARSFQRLTRHATTAVAGVASIVLLAACDLDKITGTPKEVTPAEVAQLFSIIGDTTVAVGGTTALTISSAADLRRTIQRWSSSDVALAAVDSVSGIVTGIRIGRVVITARLLAPELDSGYTRAHAMRVR